MIPIPDMRFVHFDAATGGVVQLTASASLVDGALDIAEVIGEIPTGPDIANYRVDLASFDGGTCSLIAVPVEERFVVPLADIKAALRTAIDAQAERERTKYITPGDGQALAYEAKRTEATRWRNAGMPAEPDGALYPWAADRADNFNVPVHDVLAEWAAQAGAWAAIGIAIERVREATKAAIAAAEDEAGAREAAAGVSWPMNQ